MLAAGVRDFSREKCWEQYRLNSFAGFMMAVMASQLVERTDRGDLKRVGGSGDGGIG